LAGCHKRRQDERDQTPCVTAHDNIPPPVSISPLARADWRTHTKKSGRNLAQNRTLRPNWIILDGAAALSAFKLNETATTESVLKLTQLQILKDSARNSLANLSLIVNFLMIEKSRFFWPGPVTMFRPEVP